MKHNDNFSKNDNEDNAKFTNISECEICGILINYRLDKCEDCKNINK